MPKETNNKRRKIHDPHIPIEHDLEYWLEHVAHWALLLVVVTAAVYFVAPLV